ncbi:MAG TPA: hypothetical protein VFS25_08350 [Chitinophaga sp.]|uniref:hypothetical protein n=1 Tax=Chitinophaga sp. TaxID=1869181 RepID=UPI002DBC447E|nr:hypothetical protein [Chitinophaga sp.]HEU4552830.1 hypothetical protein [Chitinophaga sp.]
MPTLRAQNRIVVFQSDARLQAPAGGKVQVKVFHIGRPVYQGIMPYAHTFGDVPIGQLCRRLPY